MHSVPMIVALAFYAVATLLYLLYLSGVRPSALSAAGPVLAVAALVHLGAIGWHHLGGLPPPITSPAGLLNLAVFVGVAAFLIAGLFRRMTLAGAFLAPVATMLVGTLVNNAGVPVTPPHLEFIRFVTPVHIVTAAIGFTCFGLAFLSSSLMLVVDHRMREKLGRGWPPLPPISTLERVSFTAVRIGFPFYTLGVVLGAVWAYWGRPDGALIPEYMLGVAVWLLYAVLVVLFVVSGWRGRKAAVLTMLGFVSTLPIVVMYALRRLG